MKVGGTLKCCADRIKDWQKIKIQDHIYMNTYFNKIKEAASFIKEQLPYSPETGIILGSGLGVAMQTVQWDVSIPYASIPHFAATSVKGHSGQLLVGSISGHPVIVQSGRFHYYEGHDMRTVCFPLRVLHALGIKRLVVTNAAGGLNRRYHDGLLVAITDHINMFPDHPLRGLNDERFGNRFPEMVDAYTPELRSKFMRVGKALGIDIDEGVYLGLSGPSIETPAELRFMQMIGADLVGMSTVPEVIVAKQLELEVLAVSIVTNMCFPEFDTDENMHEKVLQVAGKAALDLFEILKQLLAEGVGK